MTIRLWPEVESGPIITTPPDDAAIIRIVPYIKGDPGDAATQFIHTQAVSSDTWTVNHNKGARPNAVVYSVGWVEIEATITHVSENQLTVHLNLPQAGFVIC